MLFALAQAQDQALALAQAQDQALALAQAQDQALAQAQAHQAHHRLHGHLRRSSSIKTTIIITTNRTCTPPSWPSLQASGPHLLSRRSGWHPCCNPLFESCRWPCWGKRTCNSCMNKNTKNQGNCRRVNKSYIKNICWVEYDPTKVPTFHWRRLNSRRDFHQETLLRFATSIVGSQRAAPARSWSDRGRRGRSREK